MNFSTSATKSASLVTFFVIVGFVLIQFGTLNFASHPTLNATLMVLSVIGVVILFQFDHNVPGLSAQEQTYLVMVSTLLIVVGNITLPMNVPWYYPVALQILGVIGFGLKEALGELPPPTTSTDGLESVKRFLRQSDVALVTFLGGVVTLVVLVMRLFGTVVPSLSLSIAFPALATTVVWLIISAVVAFYAAISK